MSFPTNLNGLSAQLLTKVIKQNYPSVIVQSFEILKRARCGDGIASTADRIMLSLSYAPGHSANLPTRILLKTILLHRYLRFGIRMILLLSKTLRMFDGIPVINRFVRPLVFALINIYQRFFPHAPAAMYENEVHFYQHIRPLLEIETPRTYGSIFEKNSGQFGILMEDLSLRGTIFPNATMDLSLTQITHLLRNLAHLHAYNWKNTNLKDLYPWLPKTFCGGMFPVFDAIGLDLVRNQVQANAFKQKLLEPLNRDIDTLWNAVWKAQRLLYEREPITLLHGDAHVGNTYLIDNRVGGMLDWQLMVEGPWVHDVCYLLVTALKRDDRKKYEKSLLQYYFNCLEEFGIDKLPKESDYWLSYQIAVIWGLVIGWLITPPQNYGVEITSANISRLVSAAIDLQSFETLDKLRSI